MSDPAEPPPGPPQPPQPPQPPSSPSPSGGDDERPLSPAEAWPFPTGNRDLSDGLLDYGASELYAARTFLDEVTIIRRLRIGVTAVLVVVLLGLGVGLGVTIHAFTRQVDRATPEIRHLVDAAKSGESKATVTTAAVVPASGASAPVVAVVDPPAVTTSVKVDIASMAGSIVAVISILVVAISAIAISLLRATFTLAPHRRGEPGGAVKDSPKASEGSVPPLPATELFKDLVDCFKAVLGKSK